MDDLIAFIKARLDEDEAVAEAASEGDDKAAVWALRDHPSESVMIRDGLGSVVVYDEGAPSEEQAAHIARYDPARALREAEAGRRILSRHEYCAPYGGGPCDHAGTVDDPPCPDMRDLAARWSDHADYREEWKP